MGLSPHRLSWADLAKRLLADASLEPELDPDRATILGPVRDFQDTDESHEAQRELRWSESPMGRLTLFSRRCADWIEGIRTQTA